MKGRLAHCGVLLTAGLLVGCLGACPADIVADICRHCPASPHRFEAYLAAVHALRDNPRVTVSEIGHSRQGRPLLQVMVRDPQVPLEETVRVYLIARQHGSESSGTEACLALVRHFATSQDELELSLLRQITWIAVPVANPDGMAGGNRGNGGGLDLNRDWARLSQPETRAIQTAVLKARPHALVDMHELPASSSKTAFRGNFVQTIGGGGLPDYLTRDCDVTSSRLASWLGKSGMPINLYYDTAGEDGRLCHRHFGLKAQIPSYLFEAKNGPGRTLAVRTRFHVLGALVVGNYALHRYYAPVAEPAPVDTLEPPPPAVTPEAPAVALEQPQDRQTARGELPVVARVNAAEQVAYVQFAVDGRVRALCNAAPHRFPLNTCAYPDGEHTIAAQACDAGGRVLAETSVTILVDNRTTAGE